MSWTLIGMRAPTSAEHPAELPEQLPPIAARADVVEVLSDLLPETTWSSLRHALFVTPNAALEIDLQEEDPVPYLSMTLRGDYSELEPRIAAVLDSLDLRAVGEDGEFYELQGS